LIRYTKLCKEWYSPSTTHADGNKSPAARNSSNLNIRAGNLHTTYTQTFIIPLLL